jgi:hypothetical protein
MKYGEPRYTKDLDVWVRGSAENSERLYRALAEFGAPLLHDGITPDTFCKEGIVYQIGVAPVRIDILNHLTGVTFEDAWNRRVESAMFGVPVYFISRKDLISNKLAAGRFTDLEDVRRLDDKS